MYTNMVDFLFRYSTYRMIHDKSFKLWHYHDSLHSQNWNLVNSSISSSSSSSSGIPPTQNHGFNIQLCVHGR